MQYRSADEILAMTYRHYKIDVWRRLAEGWREKIGNDLHDQDYVRAKIDRCEGMSMMFAGSLSIAKYE
jgi:hypothetical protein